MARSQRIGELGGVLCERENAGYVLRERCEARWTALTGIHWARVLGTVALQQIGSARGCGGP